MKEFETKILVVFCIQVHKSCDSVDETYLQTLIKMLRLVFIICSGGRGKVFGLVVVETTPVREAKDGCDFVES